MVATAEPVDAVLNRRPPHDAEAERAVLGGMLLSRDAIIDVAEILRGVDFYSPANELIFDVVVGLHGRGDPTDPLATADALERAGDLARVGGPAYLHTLLSSVPTAANAGYYARIVHDRAVLRRLVTAGTRIVQLGYATDGGDVDEIVNAAQAEIGKVVDDRQGDDCVALADAIEDAINEIEASSARGDGLTGVPTGYADLDRLTNGLHPGQVIVVAARPAMGKSTVALDIARTAAIHHGMAVAFFSLEMSRTEITTRLLSAESRIPLQTLRTGKMSEDDWSRIARTMGDVTDAPLFIDDSPSLSPTTIRSKCLRLRQRHDLKLVVVDYMQLMSSGKKVESRQQEVSEFSRALKMLAKELGVPVIALSQLNRGSEQRSDKRPQLSDLRESGSIEQDADIVILLHREDVYDKETPRAGEADFIVAKHRNGPTDTIVVAFQGQYSRFVDMWKP